jgi:putative ABC transport system ATP-binding protein
VAEPLISCRGVIKIYASAAGRVTALRGVDLVVDEGALVALVGPSGSGKSSLLRIIAGLDEASAGTVSVGGVDFAEVPRRQRRLVRSRLLSHVYQRPRDNLLGHLQAIEQVRRVARHRGVPDAEADDALERVGLAHRRHHRPDDMSGGEQQRLALARSVVGHPALVIADEPTAELDTAATLAILEVIRELSAEGATILMATHDPIALEHIDHVVELRDGTVARVRRDGRDRVVIDGAGRLHLPPDVDQRFPDRTAHIDWDDDGDHMVARP